MPFVRVCSGTPWVSETLPRLRGTSVPDLAGAAVWWVSAAHGPQQLSDRPPWYRTATACVSMDTSGAEPTPKVARNPSWDETSLNLARKNAVDSSGWRYKMATKMSAELGT